MATPEQDAADQAIDDPRSFYLEGKFQGRCACCNSTGRFEVHHVIAKERCKKEHIPQHSPDNALRLCAKSPDSCHERHTTAQERVPLSKLRDENIAFAVHLGRGPAYNYLTRYYAGSDPRVDALLGDG